MREMPRRHVIGRQKRSLDRTATAKIKRTKRLEEAEGGGVSTEVDIPQARQAWQVSITKEKTKALRP